MLNQKHPTGLRQSAGAIGEQQVPSYSTVRRFMESQGLHKQRRVEARRQFAPREVRSFEVEHVNSCWHLDFHSVLTAKGIWEKPSALCILDDALG